MVGGKKGKKENEKEEVEFEVRHVGPMRKEGDRKERNWLNIALSPQEDAFAWEESTQQAISTSNSYPIYIRALSLLPLPFLFAAQRK